MGGGRLGGRDLWGEAPGGVSVFVFFFLLKEGGEGEGRGAGGGERGRSGKVGYLPSINGFAQIGQTSVGFRLLMGMRSSSVFPLPRISQSTSLPPSFASSHSTSFSRLSPLLLLVLIIFPKEGFLLYHHSRLVKLPPHSQPPTLSPTFPNPLQRRKKKQLTVQKPIPHPLHLPNRCFYPPQQLLHHSRQ